MKGHAALPRIKRGRRSARLGRQIVNLEVAGSNPVGPAIHSTFETTLPREFQHFWLDSTTTYRQ